MHVKQTHWLVVCIHPTATKGAPKTAYTVSVLETEGRRPPPLLLLHLAMTWGLTMSNLAPQLSPSRPPFAAAGMVVPSSNSTCTCSRKEADVTICSMSNFSALVPYRQGHANCADTPCQESVGRWAALLICGPGRH